MNYEPFLDLLEELAAGTPLSELAAQAAQCAECEESPEGHAQAIADDDVEPHAYEADDLARLEVIEHYGLDPEDRDSQDLLDVLNPIVLEYVVYRKGSIDDVGDITSMELVMGTGGPDDRLEISENGRVEHVHTEWFSGEGTFTKTIGYYGALAEYLFGLVERT